MRWKLVPLAAAILVLLGASAAYAHDPSTTTTTTSTTTTDWGPPPGPIFITCDQVAVDPPVPAVVTHHLTVNGVPYERSVVYGATTAGLAVADISDLTSEVGVTYNLTDYATWTLSSGRTPTFHASLLCHPAPPTSTASSSTPSSTPVTQAGEPGSTVLVGAISAESTDASGTGGGGSNATGGTSGSLPLTGDNHVGLLAGLGVGLIALGGVAASRRRRVES
jgi:LPXTG-motif cell wall-anchored protein